MYAFPSSEKGLFLWKRLTNLQAKSTVPGYLRKDFITNDTKTKEKVPRGTRDKTRRNRKEMTLLTVLPRSVCIHETNKCFLLKQTTEKGTTLRETKYIK